MTVEFAPTIRPLTPEDGGFSADVPVELNSITPVIDNTSTLNLPVLDVPPVAMAGQGSGSSLRRSYSSPSLPKYRELRMHSAQVGDLPVKHGHVEGIDPGFAAKLKRVLGRLHNEGYRCEIISCVRTAEEQSRIRRRYRAHHTPIPAARFSAHEVGAAVDVIGHGKGFYRRMHEIAVEEGLARAVKRDPHHLMLPLAEVAVLYGERFGQRMREAYEAVAFHGHRPRRPEAYASARANPARHHNRHHAASLA